MLKQIEYFIKNLLLKFLSIISRNSNSTNSVLEVNSSTKVLVIRLNRIGDALVTTPFIHLLKSKSNCRIFVLADKNNHFVFNNNPDIEKILIYKKGLFGFIKTIKSINSLSFDIIIDSHDDVSTTVSFLIASFRSKNKIGLEKSNKKVFTHTVKRPDPNKFHVIERICSLSEIFGFEFNKNELSIIYNPSDKASKHVNDLIDNLYYKKKFLLGINISAGSDARFWGTEKFKTLVKHLNQYDINVLLICHSKDYSEALKIIDKKYILNPSKDFELFAAAIQKLDMLFSPDTSAIFIAAIKKIPVFELIVKFRMNEMIWSPYNSDFDCIITEEPNLHNISFEEVWIKFKPFLEKYLISHQTK